VPISQLDPTLVLERIDPRTRYFWAISASLVFLLPIIPLGILIMVEKHSLVWLLPMCALAIWLGARYANRAIESYGYALLDDGLWVESGVHWRKATFVARVRVQHTEVGHGPLDRRMGLAKLVIHTAGIRMQHLSIPGLTEVQAHALRDALLKREGNRQLAQQVRVASDVALTTVT
jgi:uncharacterized protein